MNTSSALLAGLAVAGCATTPPAPVETIAVEVTIDFGPSQATRLRRTVVLPSGATPVDAARALAEVEQRWLCCSEDDVWSIGGVGPDPRLDRYWFWRLDGQIGPTAPSAFRLEDGARLEWVYAAYAPPDAEREAGPRILSLLPAATQIVHAIGGERWLVGLSHLCPQGDGDLPRVVSTPIDSEAWDMPTIDREVHERAARGEQLYVLDEQRIAALEPTIVLSQGLCPVCATTPETLEPLLNPSHGTCPQLVVLSPHVLADVAENIRTVGAAVGRLGAARVAAQAFELRIERVRSQPVPAPAPRVAVIEWFEPLWVSGDWIAEMVEVAGGVPLLAGPGQPSRRAGWDELVAADPDLLVLAACSMSIERAGRELALLTDHPRWKELRAVREGRVFLMDGDAHFSSPGPGLAEGLEFLHELLRDPDGAAPARAGAWSRVAPGAAQL